MVKVRSTNVRMGGGLQASSWKITVASTTMVKLVRKRMRSCKKLTTQLVQSFYAKKQKQGYSVSRVRAIHAVLHRSLEHAKRIKLVASNVCDGVELPRNEQHEIQPLTPEQARLLLQKVREHHLEALLTLALTTGMRKGEILALRWQDIDLQKGTLQIHRTLSYMAHYGFKEGEPKSAKSKRKIALPQFVTETLLRHSC